MTEERERTNILRRPDGHRGQGREDRTYELLGRFGNETSYFIKTYFCRDTRTSQQYLVRKIRLDGLRRNDVTYRRQELDLWPRLCHPNILEFIDGWEITQGHPRIFLISGLPQCTLETLLLDKGSSPPQALYEKWLYQIVSALKYLHEDHDPSQPVLHRNLKPSSIMVTEGYILKLADFAWSRMLEGAEGTASSQVGTAIIMSPEMVRGETYDAKTDIWSFGITAVYIATLQHAVQARTFDTLFRKTRQGEVHGVAGVYSEDIHNLVNRMLHVDPRQRPSASKIIEDLKLVFRNCTRPPSLDSYPQRRFQPERPAPAPQTRHVSVQSTLPTHVGVNPEEVRVSASSFRANVELTIESLSLTIVIQVTTSERSDLSRHDRGSSAHVNVQINRPGSGRALSSRGYGRPSPDAPGPKKQQASPEDGASSSRLAEMQLEPQPPEEPPAPEEPPTPVGEDEDLPDEDSSSPNPMLINTFPGAYGMDRKPPYAGPLPPLVKPPLQKKKCSGKSSRRISDPSPSQAAVFGGVPGEATRAEQDREESPRRPHALNRSRSVIDNKLFTPPEPSPPLPVAPPLDILPGQWKPGMRDYWNTATGLLSKMAPGKFWLVIKLTKLFSRQEVKMWLEENVGEGFGSHIDEFVHLVDLDNKLTREENLCLLRTLHKPPSARGDNTDDPEDSGVEGDDLSRRSSRSFRDSSSDFETQ